MQKVSAELVLPCEGFAELVVCSDPEVRCVLVHPLSCTKPLKGVAERGKLFLFPFSYCFIDIQNVDCPRSDMQSFDLS